MAFTPFLPNKKNLRLAYFMSYDVVSFRRVFELRSNYPLILIRLVSAVLQVDAPLIAMQGNYWRFISDTAFKFLVCLFLVIEAGLF